MTPTNDLLLDSAIRHQVYLQRYSSGLVYKLIALLNRTDADLVAKIQSIDSSWSSKRLEKLLEEIRVVNRDAYDLIQRELTNNLKGLSVYESGFQAKAISNAVPVALNIIQPSQELLYAAMASRPFQGKYLREWFSDIEEARFKRVRDAVRIGMVEGETIDQIVRRVRGSRVLNYADGLLDIDRRGAEAMIRTAVTHTTTFARQTLFESNSNIIKGVQWVSTLDGRTSATCRSRDGKVYPLTTGPRPPVHPGCRSSIIPVIKSWKELGIDLNEAPEGTRASMSGQVAAKETYQTWLSKQPKAFVEEVLGKTRAKLYLKGGLTLDRFVDRSGHQYTLDQLRIKDASAFEQAGL